MKQLFINLPVRDLEASLHFYRNIGFTAEPLFSFRDQQCVTWGEQIFVMLQSYDMFRAGNKKQLADPQTQAIASFTLPVESPAKLNELAVLAVKAGGSEAAPAIDEDFMQGRKFEDPDGHLWTFIYLDIEKYRRMKEK